MIKTATALLGAALLLAAQPAGAQEAGSDLVVSTRIVTSRDLDLRSASGRMALDRRIATAARAVCREEGLFNIRIANGECLRTALSSANRQRDRIFAARGILGEYRSAEVAR
ncbi:UrcA family protein [Sphingomonas sp. LHG3406-1]|uniref:UrcA family protein n=1 Tax=Sphingomonas sp. LHG3406-1 TaxID=2804617 RepID=UPI002627DF13|nr:UrcA family protein [Sphingomonas sp. LHG3406-1]